MVHEFVVIVGVEGVARRLIMVKTSILFKVYNVFINSLRVL